MRPPSSTDHATLERFRAPWWLPGGTLQTIWPALFARRTAGPAPAYRRERWTTPDDDFVDVDYLQAPAVPGQPLLVLFHGLEGSSRSHYAEAFADVAARAGLAFAVPHFRGCSGEMNLAPRAYHSGDHVEIGWMLARLRAAHDGPLLAVGVSQGG
jgi:predicted alpha/beta-fold hydrolase